MRDNLKHGGAGGGGGGGNQTGVGGVQFGPAGGSPTDGLPAPPGCGDGALTDDEACDDGNMNAGDGCAANCLSVEAGYSCNPAGVACHAVARCGDGIVASSELCDDGGRADGDGCSSSCKLEVGFKCAGAPSTCTPTKCGDGVKEGAEACDDGNDVPFDGCSGTCQAEPNCGKGACSSRCGDGLVLNEECDDGNDKDGDGCSSKCTVEGGNTCTTEHSCEKKDGKCILRVPVIFHDFNASHPDFEIGCGELTRGVVENVLGPTGVPTLANGASACIESAATFAEWYAPSKNNSTIVSQLVLYEKTGGGFVN
ncbi:MAG TPA: DUF4215 domain-containing protein, partial [Polyangiaceae bacterium]